MTDVAERATGTALTDEVHAWVDANWRLDLTVREWWRRLVEAGYAYPAWPPGAGGAGMSGADGRAVTRTLAAHRVVGPPVGHVAATLAAPTILTHGTPEQVARARPGDRAGRGVVVPALQRARVGFRPGQHRDACRTRR